MKTCTYPLNLFKEQVCFFISKEAEEAYRRKNACGQPAVAQVSVRLAGRLTEIVACSKHKFRPDDPMWVEL